jgi:hypothetical protein
VLLSDVGPRTAPGNSLVAFKIDFVIRKTKALALHEQNALLSGNAEFQTICDAFCTFDEVGCRRWRANFNGCFAK